MIIFYSKSVSEKSAYLVDDEYIHCTRVLRHKIGDLVNFTDGKGNLYKGIIDNVSKKQIVISSLILINKTVRGHIRGIAIAPTKNIARFEWFLEKATEIGITDIYPFISKRSERKIIKPRRLEKILISAMKQSKNYHLPIFHPLLPFSEVMTKDYNNKTKYIAHCMEPELGLQKLYISKDDAIVLIGPEGDFTQEEVSLASANNWLEVSLGDSRLRTETAGIIACHLLNL